MVEFVSRRRSLLAEPQLNLQVKLKEADHREAIANGPGHHQGQHQLASTSDRVPKLPRRLEGRGWSLSVHLSSGHASRDPRRARSLHAKSSFLLATEEEF
jgi:hypothetical protein